MIVSCAEHSARTREHGSSVAQHSKAEEPLWRLRERNREGGRAQRDRIKVSWKSEAVLRRKFEGSLIRPNVER